MYFLISPETKAVARSSRKGITLLVVISMLALFSIVGVGLVIYAQSEATASRYTRESESLTRPDVDPALAFHFFMQQLLYGASDDAAGIQSAIRGHSLARNMYGFNPNGTNTIPYSGTGRLDFTYQNTGTVLDGKSDLNLINYTYYSQVGNPNVPLDGFIRDPEYKGFRTSLSNPPNPADYIGGLNPPYTYPDLNNMFLAAINGKGEVLIQSFHRPWTGIGSLDPTNPNWDPNFSADPLMKYKTLRPLPSYHNNGTKHFPLPADGGGDVKNWPGLGVPDPNNPGKYFNNDSIWMDLGYPVMTGPNGTRYKILFAPLIVDLDGKINLNVHGNIMGPSNSHSSNQGWGPWEVNIAKVLSSGSEWQNLFVGNTSIEGKYGGDQLPATQGGNASGGRPPYFYGRVDFDGEGPASTHFLLPGETSGAATPISHPGFAAFARFLPVRYGDNNATESLDHASLFNPFIPAPDDRPFDVSNMEALLRYGDTGSPALSSRLFQLCPNNFLTPQIRRLVTTHSADLIHPGAAPWLYRFQATTQQQQAKLYRLAQNAEFPIGAAVESPAGLRALPTATIINSGEFAGTLRSVTAGFGARVDLNRSLGQFPYPPSDATQRMRLYPYITNYPHFPEFLVLDHMQYPAVKTQFHNAEDNRKQLAKDIFDRLVLLTTGLRPGDTWPAKGTQEYDALRWLAQLSVNIVDYRDEDDVCTAFRWNPTDKKEFVFGTELPRVVLNEVLVEMNFTPGPPGQNRGKGPFIIPPGQLKKGNFSYNFWIELHNPLESDANLTFQGAARLQADVLNGAGQLTGSDPVYKIVILKSDPGQPPQRKLDDHDNPTGDFVAADKVLEVDDFRPPNPVAGVDPTFILPADGNFSETPGGNRGFYVLGPENDLTPQGMNFPPTLVRRNVNGMPGGKGLNYRPQPGGMGNPTKTFFQRKHTILLRRLANPYIPWQKNPDLEHYNPYITVDYMADVEASRDFMWPLPGMGQPPPPTYTGASGRMQPYAGHQSQLKPQNPAGLGQNMQKHTLFRNNSVEPMPPYAPGGNQTIATPFDWLVHLDRQVISPMELLHVSAFPPHRLTQRFIIPDPNPPPNPPPNSPPAVLKFRHYAPWFNENARIYRLFEFLRTGSRIRNIHRRPQDESRLPGKININTIFDEEVFQALCDAAVPPAPPAVTPPVGELQYTTADVRAMFNAMMLKRTPNVAAPSAGGLGMPIPDLNDRPFKSIATGVMPPGDPLAPNGSGIQDTFLTSGGGSSPLLAINSQKHPYRRYELMTKIFNNVTTRSNVFAVWVTVGFFEVTDESTLPVKLGAEIGKAENRHVRYRFFAVVDRTKLAAMRPIFTHLDTAVVERDADPNNPLTSEKLPPGVQKVTLRRLSGTIAPFIAASPKASHKLDIQPGTVLQIASGAAREFVVVQKVDPGKKEITAYFHKPHNKFTSVRVAGADYLRNGILGHPGPDPAQYRRYYYTVVPHFSVIEGE